MSDKDQLEVFKEHLGGDKGSVWIVSDVKGYDLTLIHLFDLVNKGKENAKKLNLDNFLQDPRHHLSQGDGEKMDYTPGALLWLTPQQSSLGYTYHMANCGPTDERGYMQWAWAKNILGIKRTENLDPKWKVGEGEFRKLSIENATKQ